MASRNRLSGARILISNDDGINARGLKLLEQLARTFSDDIWIVAPESEQSGAGHSLTFTSPLRVRKVKKQFYAVDGTPTDCILLAIKHIIPDHPPDIVLSGVNAGSNMGEDVTYSGTVAAAMEATLLGVPAIALSQDREGPSVKWATAETHGPEVLDRLGRMDWPKNVLINVNFPDVEADAVNGIEIARQGRRKPGDDVTIGHDPRGYEYVWIGTQRRDGPLRAGTDLAATGAGAIAITPLTMNMTDERTLKAMRAAIS